MKKIIFPLLFICQIALAQNEFKNYVGLSFAPTLSKVYFSSGNIDNKVGYSNSFSLNYNRKLKGKFHLQFGLGYFQFAEYIKFSGYNCVDCDMLVVKPTPPEVKFIDGELNISLKPKFIFGKYLLFSTGLNTEFNFWVKEKMITKRFDSNEKLIEKESQNRTLSHPFNPSFWTGVFGGIGYQHKNLIFFLEPELKTQIWYANSDNNFKVYHVSFLFNTSVNYCF